MICGRGARVVSWTEANVTTTVKSRATAGTLGFTRHSAATHDARPAVPFTARGSSHFGAWGDRPGNGAELSNGCLSLLTRMF